MLFISDAFAQSAGAAAGPESALGGLLPLILIFVIFYFLLIRPQQKKYKQHQAMINAVSKGDEVVTGGGIAGKVTKVEDEWAYVDIASGVNVKVAKATLSNVINPKAAKEDAKQQATTKQSEQADKPKSRKKVANDN